MYNRYEVYYRGELMGQITALSDNSALDKSKVLVEMATGIRRSASKYSGLDTRVIRVKKL